jgi:hypothetical protein
MTSPDDDICALINEATSTRDTPASTATDAVQHRPAGTHRQGSLDLALQAARGVPAGTKPLRQVERRSVSRTTPADLSRVVEQVHTEVDASAMRPKQTWSQRNARTLLGFVGIALLLAAWAWYARAPAMTGHPATLDNLALAVEEYRLQHNGSLPEQLSKLEQFPKSAVEWQPRHWKARDAAGRTEIVWLPNGSKHYRIVLRQGNAVWIYNDVTGTSRQAQPLRTNP